MVQLWVHEFWADCGGSHRGCLHRVKIVCRKEPLSLSLQCKAKVHRAKTYLELYRVLVPLYELGILYLIFIYCMLWLNIMGTIGKDVCVEDQLCGLAGICRQWSLIRFNDLLFTHSLVKTNLLTLFSSGYSLFYWILLLKNSISSILSKAPSFSSPSPPEGDFLNWKN